MSIVTFAFLSSGLHLEVFHSSASSSNRTSINQNKGKLGKKKLNLTGRCKITEYLV